MIKQMVKKKVRKAVISLIIALFPILVLLLLMYAGLFGAASMFETLFDNGFDPETCTDEEFYDAVAHWPYKISGEMLESWMVSRSSMKYILKETIDYNNTDNKIRLRVKGTDEYSRYIKKSYTYVSNGEKKTGYYYELKHYCVPHYQTITVSDSWLYYQFPVDWQIVYLLCLYHEIEDDLSYYEYIDEHGDLPDSYILDVKRSFVKEVVKDVAATIEYEFNIYDLLGEFGNSLNLTNDEITGSGMYYVDASYTYYSDVLHVITLYYPRTVVNSVQTIDKKFIFKNLGREITVPYRNDASENGESSNTRPSSSQTTLQKAITGRTAPFKAYYNTEKLMDLLEKYGFEREIDVFLEALELLPQGEPIAEEIRYSLEHPNEEVDIPSRLQ